jgi:acyl dehydratase
MSTIETAETGLRVTVDELAAHAGEQLGPSAWRTLTQHQVDEFADLTEDRNPIHIDPEYANGTPFGTTIVHGYFTVALLAPMLEELLSVSGASLAINYGIDKLRFPAPIPVGARCRCSARLTKVTQIDGGVQICLTVTVEAEALSKPALVAECLFRYYQ